MPRRPSRLLDYFLVVGLPAARVDAALAQPDAFALEHTPEVLARYPWADRDDFPLELQALPLLCVPNDLRLQPEIEPPVFHSFVMTKGDGSSAYGFCYTVHEERRAADDAAAPTVYVPKCLCILTHWPLSNSFKSYLQQLHSYSVTPPAIHDVPVECQLYSLFHDVPFPAAGGEPVAFGVYEPIVVQRPPENSLPLFDLSLASLFSALNVDNIILLFQCILLEKRIILLSSQLHLLTDVAETMTKFVFPFYWVGCYIPNLSSKLRHVVEAPMPYIVGIFSEESVAALDLPPDVIVVHLDEDEIHFGQEEMPPLPERERDVLRAALLSVAESKGQPTETMSARAMIRFVQEIFLAFFLSILSNYQSFLLDKDHVGSSLGSTPSSAPLPIGDGHGHGSWDGSHAGTPASDDGAHPRLERRVSQYDGDRGPDASGSALSANLAQLSDTVRFDINGFLTEQAPSSRPFLALFLQSQMFTAFVEARLDDQDDPEIEFFDACIDMYSNSTDDESQQHFRVPVEFEEMPAAREWIKATTEGFSFPPGVLTDERLHSFPLFDRAVFPESLPEPLRRTSSAGVATESRRKTQMMARSAQMISTSNTGDASSQLKDMLLQKFSECTVHLIVSCSHKKGQSKRSLADVQAAQDAGILGFCNVLERIFAHDRTERATLSASRDSAAFWDFVRECAISQIAADVAFVEQMPHLKANVSRARAWIRLSLEKKELYNHMDLMLSDREHINRRYLPSAFLYDENCRLLLLTKILSLLEVDFDSLFTRQYDAVVADKPMKPAKVSRTMSVSDRINSWLGGARSPTTSSHKLVAAAASHSSQRELRVRTPPSESSPDLLHSVSPSLLSDNGESRGSPSAHEGAGDGSAPEGEAGHEDGDEEAAALSAASPVASTASLLTRMLRSPETAKASLPVPANGAKPPSPDKPAGFKFKFFKGGGHQRTQSSMF